jgi:hypothetical protein
MCPDGAGAFHPRPDSSRNDRVWIGLLGPFEVLRDGVPVLVTSGVGGRHRRLRVGETPPVDLRRTVQT